MGSSRTMVLVALAGLFFCLAGCAENSSGSLFNSKMLSGDLVENKSNGGQIQRLRVGGLESWQRWNANSIRGDDDNVVLKAEATF
jgi:hypothetical protein